MGQIPIIDSDRHVVESNAMWRDYLPREMHQFIPYLDKQEASQGAKEQQLLPAYMIDGKPLLKQWNENQRIQIEAAKNSSACISELNMATSPALQLKTMDESGISSAFLFPTYATFIINNENLSWEVSLAFANAYNSWLKDYCTDSDKRLLGVGMVSRHAPDTMPGQLEAISELGFKTILLRPEMILGRMLGHADYNEFWKQCEQRDITVALHGGTHLHACTVGTDRFTKHFSLHACSHPMEIQMAFLSLLESGVLERHPNLRFAFLEAGASWVPHWLWRLDEICYGMLPGEVEDVIKMKPSEYFKRQCWVGIELEEPCLGEVVNYIGVDCLLFGSDFPHPDHLQFDIRSITQKCSLSSKELEAVLHDNPKQCFKSSFN